MRKLDHEASPDTEAAGIDRLDSHAPIADDELARLAAELEDAGARRSRPGRRGRQWRARPALTGLSVVAYVGLFIATYNVAGMAAAIWAALPVTVVAAYWGTTGGLLVSVLAVAGNYALASLLGGDLEALLLRPSGILGATALMVMGVAIGAMREAAARAAPDPGVSDTTLRAVFDRAPVGLARVSMDGRILQANTALAKMLGLSATAPDRASLARLFQAEGDGPAIDPFDELRSSLRDAYRVVRRYRRADKSWGWASVNAAIVRDDEGTPEYGILIADDITEDRQQLASLEHQALHDSLTELPNRVLLMDRLRQSIRHADRESSRVALLVMDLDRFKFVNDTMGHQVGDILLQEVGRRVQAQARESDTVARLGGDEFAVLLPVGGDATIATIVAHKVLEGLAAPYELHGQPVNLRASIGIALFPGHGDDAETLMRRADVAMYAAKRERSGFALYADSHDSHLVGALALAADLNLAIERDELYLEYQPVADLATGSIEQVEALVRWRHPAHGVIMPDDFVELAEDTGQIKPLTDWVVSSALTQCQRWHDDGLDLNVAMNVPAQMLESSFFLHTLEGQLVALGVDPEAVTLEITETTLMREPERAMRLLERLRDMGVRICIDDFGTGYSALSYLKRLAVNEIKIDRSFVREIARDRGDATIVGATIDLAHKLGLRVIAEGVEDEDGWRRLRDFACDAAQGFYVSAALDAERVPAFVASARAGPPPAPN